MTIKALDGLKKSITKMRFEEYRSAFNSTILNTNQSAEQSRFIYYTNNSNEIHQQISF